MCKISDNRFNQLRITRAYIKLLCIPEGDARMVVLARIGSYEICMFECPETGSAATPLFVLELFDHDAHFSVDSCVCHNIEEGVAAFEDFISR